MKSLHDKQSSAIKRRNFLKSAGVVVIGVAGMGTRASAKPSDAEKKVRRSRDERLKQIASNSYAVNQLFKRRPYGSRPERPETTALKEKYGEITLLDFPQFTLDTYPGVPAMDLWSSLFGDLSDDSMFTTRERNGRSYLGDFDPGAPSAKSYLDQLADKIAG
jgi:hypothetical protein